MGSDSSCTCNDIKRMELEGLSDSAGAAEKLGLELGAATMTSAELINRSDDLGRLRAGYLADIIAVPGDPSEDITMTEDVRFVMKEELCTPVSRRS